MNAMNILTAAASIITIFVGVLQLWKTLNSLSAEQQRTLKQNTRHAKWFATLAFGTCLFGWFSISEFLSEEPINKLNMAKAVGFAFLSTIWFCMHFIQGLFFIVDGHNQIIGKAIEILADSTNKQNQSDA